MLHTTPPDPAPLARRPDPAGPLAVATPTTRSGVEGIPWKHGPPTRDTSARAGVTAFGPGRWCDEHNLVGSALSGV